MSASEQVSKASSWQLLPKILGVKQDMESYSKFEGSSHDSIIKTLLRWEHEIFESFKSARIVTSNVSEIYHEIISNNANLMQGL